MSESASIPTNSETAEFYGNVSNPILQRELVGTLRAPRAAWALSGVVVLLGALTLALWPSGGVYSLGEQASHTLLNSVALGGLLLALLIAPSFTATCLTSEKENSSYELLTHTLLRPWEIAWGKIVSAQCFLLLLVFSTLPILAATLFLGGTSIGQLLLIFAVIATATLATGLLGFALSAWCRESFTALVITYGVTLLWTALPMLPPLLLRALIVDLPILGILVYSSPFATMLSLVEPDLLVRLDFPVAATRAPSIYFTACGIFALIAWVSGTLRILKPDLSGARRSSKSETHPSHLKFPYVLIDPRRRKHLIGNYANPVLAKELRSKTFGQAPWVIRGMYATFTVSLLLVGLMVKGGAGLHLDVLKLAMIAFQILVVILLSPSLLAGALTQEVEQRQFDLLRQTLIAPHTFLIGKTVSAWLLIVLLLVASVPMWWMMAYLESYQWTGTLVSLVVVAVTLLFASAVSLLATMLARTTAVATALAYGAVSLPAFGALVPLLMGNSLSSQWRSAILAWNPFTAGLQAVSTEFLRNEGVLWKPYLAQTFVVSLFCFCIAWLLLWNKLRKE